MFREFFLSGPRRRILCAWAGLAIFVCHALFRAWLKWRLNSWYSKFFDTLGSASEQGSGEGEFLAEKRAAVSAELLEFALIVLPAVFVNPIGKWIASVWRFSWRMALVQSYLAHYDVAARPIEGAAQRIHEDSQRFETGMHACVTMVLDSFLTLLVFIPVLHEVGAETNPGSPGWLICIAVSAAVGGIGVSVIVGRRLVHLEVQNQVTEARLRTKLVLLEQSPASVVGNAPDDVDDVVDGRFHDVEPRLPRPRAVSPSGAFALPLEELRTNYTRLFREFCKFNTWVAIYDQSLVLAPYLLVAPLLFADDASARITLGTLTKTSNAFGNVFGALAIVTEGWAQVNDFRSTLQRLREFENHVYARRRSGHLELREDAITEHAPAVELE